MRLFILLLASLIPLKPFAQNYQPDWQSLDQRPVPTWFTDAKFGIFIHWGVYAVPGWSSKGNYAEWYQQGLQTTDTARQKFHKAKFGDRTYYDLANDFKAELFNPDDWAKLIEQSGAKYIVLTSKHHDGFTLWPSKEANKTWGFKWNAVDVGPKRDLLGDLFKAVRKTSVRAGMYYSLYEWFNPLWKSDKDKFVKEHTWPQMKDLINNYQPDVFWTDGDWDVTAETWKSQEFLAWLYNESPVKDKIVVNDRWGSGIRFKHAGIYTPEYQPDLDFEDHYWEESRGMGYSYGYNREEDAWDYNSTQSLVLQLIDKVSRGGNFLLDIGPDEHGKIPPIMQERLLQMGEWLKINGEAIYNTTRWKESSQWGEGNREYKDRSGDMLLKITVDPDPGYAVKEVFYTYNATTNSLYAILPKYPDNKEVKLRNVILPAGTTVSLLSTHEKLDWKTVTDNTVIKLPEYNPNKIKAPYAHVVKIEGYGNYMFKPKINVKYENGSLVPTVSISANSLANIFYTTDGSQPTGKSNLYHQPFKLDKTAIIKAAAFKISLPGAYMPAIESATVSEQVVKYEWKSAVKAENIKPGISYKYYQPEQNINMVSSFKSNVVNAGVANIISVARKQRADKFAFDFSGYIKIDKDAVYDFFTASDDGSKLFIDDDEIVNNDGDHGTEEKGGKAALRKGYHKIKVLYFDSGGGNELKVFIQPQGGIKQELAAGILFH
ncbi:MAG: alpha-L-fucosidase [Chitinophagaceae bacterium]|nr:alpha-L-fucosidase [Chitinophagaceae bacterium]